MLTNFLEMGIPGDNIHILGSTWGPRVAEPWLKLQNKFTQVNFFFYVDSTPRRKYIPSLRPHILAKHFKQYPKLSQECVLYHDSDIIFLKSPGFSELLQGDVWYVSDTASYLSASYVKSKGLGLYEEMCSIVGIDPSIPEANEDNTGGAQYIMKGLTSEFWAKVERECTSMFTFLDAHRRKHPDTPDYHGIQHWTTDMWVVLWNAWLAGKQVRTHGLLEFAWAKDLNPHPKDPYILHNAGVVGDEQDKFFHKSKYTNRLPYFDDLDVNPNFMSRRYWEAVQKVGEHTCLR